MFCVPLFCSLIHLNDVIRMRRRIRFHDKEQSEL